LWKKQVLLKDFGVYAKTLTEQLKQASCQAAQQQRRPVLYLASSKTDKDALAREIAETERVRQGLVAVFSCVESCSSYEVYRNRERKRLELAPRFRKCLHLYHYFIDPQFGFMNARIQSWLPFDMPICLNGREWLARQMERAGLGYHRQDNCLSWLEQAEQAQRLIDRQFKTAWAWALQRIVRGVHPAHRKIFPDFPLGYYWSVFQSEWATDVMFKTPAALAEIYPSFVTHAMSTFSSADVMRFLGRKVHGAFPGEIVTDFKHRLEGIRVKHRVDKNSINFYDSLGICGWKPPSTTLPTSRCSDPSKTTPGVNMIGGPCAVVSPSCIGERRCRKPATSATWMRWPPRTPPRRWGNWCVRFPSQRS
jgi:hypothetical protein